MSPPITLEEGPDEAPHRTPDETPDEMKSGPNHTQK